MAEITLHVLKPSVNNLTARVFVRAAELDFEEVDAWGKTTTPEFLEMNPAHLTPMIEEQGLPRATLWESCAIMQYLCNKHGLERFYPTDPAARAMVDSAMFYLIGTLYPLVARATYPVLAFPQYPGEVGCLRSGRQPQGRRPAGRDRRVGRAAGRLPHVLSGRQAVHRRRLAVDRRYPPGGDARVPELDRLRLPRLVDRVHGVGGEGPGRGVYRAGGRRARLHRVRAFAIVGQASDGGCRWAGMQMEWEIVNEEIEKCAQCQALALVVDRTPSPWQARLCAPRHLLLPRPLHVQPGRPRSLNAR